MVLLIISIEAGISAAMTGRLRESASMRTKPKDSCVEGEIRMEELSIIFDKEWFGKLVIIFIRFLKLKDKELILFSIIGKYRVFCPAMVR